MHTYQNANIAGIYFVKDQIYFYQGDMEHFVSKVRCIWSEGECMRFGDFELESDKTQFFLQKHLTNIESLHV